MHAFILLAPPKGNFRFYSPGMQLLLPLRQLYVPVSQADYVRKLSAFCHNGTDLSGSGFFPLPKWKITKSVPMLGLVLSLFLFILHSFYFFPSCFVAGILYICVLLGEQKEQQPDKNWKKIRKKIWWNYILDVSIAVSMTLFFLLPTGLAILGNKKDVGNSTSLFKILAVNPTLDSILYSPYGCGLTLFCLYALFLAIREKKTRKLAITVFVLLFFDIFYWILNATLYVRPKCMIPFLPLILYLTALVLDGLCQKKIRHSLPLALLCIAAASIQMIFLIRAALVHAIIFADMMILLILVLYEILREKKGITFSLFPGAGGILSFFFFVPPRFSFILQEDIRKTMLP